MLNKKSKIYKLKKKKKMKKVLFLFVALISFSAMSQTEPTRNKFVSVGLSASQGEFVTNCYPSVEVGFSRENLSYSAIVGRGDFKGMFRNGDNLKNYYYELKFSPSYTIGSVNGFLIAGGGAYYNTDHYFMELGFGLSYTHKRFSYGASFSNWDTKNYITPFVSFSF